MKVYLWIRRTKKYLDGEIDDCLRRNKKQFVRNVCVWNLFFKMDYFTFRRKLSEISSLTYLPNNFDEIFHYEDWDRLGKSDKALLVPIDEDDWVHPNLVETLKSFTIDGDNLLRWKTININIDGICSTKLPHGCLKTRSCSYAILSNYPQRMISDHQITHYYIQDFPERVFDLDDYLSVKIDTISSISYLREVSSEEWIRFSREKKMLQYKACLYPYRDVVKKYNELMEEFYDSSKI